MFIMTFLTASRTCNFVGKERGSTHHKESGYMDGYVQRMRVFEFAIFGSKSQHLRVRADISYFLGISPQILHRLLLALTSKNRKSFWAIMTDTEQVALDDPYIKIRSSIFLI